jgi:hypothetical protein
MKQSHPAGICLSLVTLAILLVDRAIAEDAAIGRANQEG